jgi:hypothetical protein
MTPSDGAEASDADSAASGRGHVVARTARHEAAGGDYDGASAGDGGASADGDEEDEGEYDDGESEDGDSLLPRGVVATAEGKFEAQMKVASSGSVISFGVFEDPIAASVAAERGRQAYMAQGSRVKQTPGGRKPAGASGAAKGSSLLQAKAPAGTVPLQPASAGPHAESAAPSDAGYQAAVPAAAVHPLVALFPYGLTSCLPPPPPGAVAAADAARGAAAALAAPPPPIEVAALIAAGVSGSGGNGSFEVRGVAGGAASASAATGKPASAAASSAPAAGKRPRANSAGSDYAGSNGGDDSDENFAPGRKAAKRPSRAKKGRGGARA